MLAATVLAVLYGLVWSPADREMGDLVRPMIRASIEAYLRRDLDEAKLLPAMDQPVDRLNANMYKEIVAAMNQPDLKRIWAEQGADAGGMPPAEMEKLVKSEIAKWAKVVKDAGARVDN